MNEPRQQTPHNPHVKEVKVAINGQIQAEENIIEDANIDGVGNGGALLAEAMFDLLARGVNDVETQNNLKLVATNLDDCIAVAAGEAIRDIVVRATILQKQLNKYPQRHEELMSLLERVKQQNIKHIQQKSLSLKDRINVAINQSKLRDKAVEDITLLLQDWIEEDNIEGIYSETTTFHKFVPGNK